MRILTLVAAFAIAVPVVAQAQPANRRHSGQVDFGGNASSVNQQVGAYRVGPYKQELRDQGPVLDGLLTPDFSAIWRAQLVQGSPASALAHQQVLENDNGRHLGLTNFMQDQWIPDAPSSAPPVVAQPVVFNNSWLVPGASSNGLAGGASPEFLVVNALATDATIVNPEPSTYVLTVGGLIAMAVIKRRRRAKA